MLRKTVFYFILTNLNIGCKHEKNISHENITSSERIFPSSYKYSQSGNTKSKKYTETLKSKNKKSIHIKKINPRKKYGKSKHIATEYKISTNGKKESNVFKKSAPQKKIFKNNTNHKMKKCKKNYYWANASVIAFICYFIGLPLSLLADFFGLGLILTFSGLSILLAKNVREARIKRKIYKKAHKQKK